MTKSRKLNANKSVIFQVKGIPDSNKAHLKAIGFIEDGQEFNDEKIDVVKDIMGGDEKSIELMNTVTVKFNKPNITQEFLMSNKRLPVLYASVVYTKPLLTGVLFNITIFFDITTNTTNIKSLEQLITMDLEGKYSTDILMDDNKESMPMEKFSGYPKTVKNILTLLKTEPMLEIVRSQLKKRDQERIERYGTPADFVPSKPAYNISELADNYDPNNDIDF